MRFLCTAAAAAVPCTRSVLLPLIFLCRLPDKERPRCTERSTRTYRPLKLDTAPGVKEGEGGGLSIHHVTTKQKNDAFPAFFVIVFESCAHVPMFRTTGSLRGSISCRTLIGRAVPNSDLVEREGSWRAVERSPALGGETPRDGG